MSNRSRCLAAAAAVFLCSFAVTAAQQAPPKSKPAAGTGSAALTTSSGVYTAAQASKGEQVYMSYCLSCHPVGTYAAPSFQQKWNNSPLSQLFDWVTSMMPKNEPGSLEDEQYVNVIAYILKINGAPPGKTPLPAAAAPLRKIRIEMPAKRR